MYHTLVYNAAAAAAGGTNVDLSAATDSEITQRNSHYTFSENYKMLGVAAVGASVTRGRFQVPKWNAVGEAIIFNANRSLQPPSNPQWDLWVARPPTIPLEEEFQVQLSNNAGAPEIENVVLNIGPDTDWSQNLPQPSPDYPLVLCVRTSFTVTPTLNAWSGGQILTFSQSLRGGVYSVIGGVVQGTNAVAWRMIFPRNRMYHGRRLRPGGLIQNAVGDIVSTQLDPWVLGWGELGRFHTFELPNIEVFGTLAGAITYQAFLWLIYLGQSRTILDQWTSGGS